MDWITPQEVEVAAKKSKRAAIRCCYKHWCQIRDAAPRELQEARHKRKVGFGGDYCALCSRYPDVIGSRVSNRHCCVNDKPQFPCPLSFPEHHHCCKEHSAVVKADETYGSATRFYKAVDILCKRLKKELTIAGG